MLKDLCAALKTGGKYEVPPVSGDHSEGTRSLDVHFLETLKNLLLSIPQIDLREGVVASQSQVVPFFEGKWLQDHGASRRKGLNLGELLSSPTQDFGVADVSGHGQIKILLDPEGLDSDYIFHVWDLSMQGKLLSAPAAPLVDDWYLRTAR